MLADHRGDFTVFLGIVAPLRGEVETFRKTEIFSTKLSHKSISSTYLCACVILTNALHMVGLTTPCHILNMLVMT